MCIYIYIYIYDIYHIVWVSYIPENKSFKVSKFRSWKDSIFKHCHSWNSLKVSKNKVSECQSFKVSKFRKPNPPNSKLIETHVFYTILNFSDYEIQKIVSPNVL